MPPLDAPIERPTRIQATAVNTDTATSIDGERGARTPHDGAAWARGGWMVATALLALALVINAIASYRGSRLAIPGLNRGQADFFGAAVWELLTDTSATPNATAMQRLLHANARRGLRYLALVGGDGHVVVSAGEPTVGGAAPRRDPTTGRIPLIAANGRFRAYFPAPTLFAEQPDRAATVVIEFAPTAATRLMDVARRSVVLAVVTAGLLFVAAVVFFRISTRYESTRRRWEQRRHLTLLGEMSAVLAHEIRNPLASLKGHAQLAAERLVEGTREKRCVDNVISDAERLDALTSDLLRFARSSPLELAPVSPVELMRAAAADVFDDRALTIDDAGAPASWHMDAGRVRQALVNLLDNARQTSPDGRPPVAHVAMESERLVFEVRDFGPGLPAGREDRIFDPFFTTRATGTGLGLAVASRVAEMHGGTINASNHPDGGAVFRLTIPQLAH